MSSAELPVYLARQPILDRDGQIFAYELLFRDSPMSETAVIQNGVRATAQVLENTFNSIGLSKLVGNHRAFINCSRDMLLDNLFGSLDAHRFVLEILETVRPDERVLKAVKAYHARGFELALDDVVFTPASIRRLKPFFPYVKYAKLDLAGNSREALRKAAPFFKGLGIELLAEKVETEREFSNCLRDGYKLFQGFFFARPQLMTGQKVDATSAAILRLLQLVRSEPTLALLKRTFRKYPDLARNLLRYANTAGSSRRTPFKDVGEAIGWLGMRQFQDWLLLMLYARPEMGEKPQSSPLFQNAVERAQFLESLAREIDSEGDLPGKAFIAGIMSRMDALVKVPLEMILPEFALDKDIGAALLKRTGKLGLLLRLADAIEQNKDGEIRSCAEKLSLSPQALARSLNAAYTGGRNG